MGSSSCSRLAFLGCSFFGCSFLGCSFFGCSFFGSGFLATSFLGSGFGSGLGSGFGSGLGFGLGSAFLGSSRGTGKALAGSGAALTSSLSWAATSAFSAGAEGAGSPSPFSPMGPRMGEGVLLPPGSPSTRLICTGFVMSMSGEPTGQSQMSRMTAMCRHSDNIYVAKGMRNQSPILNAKPVWLQLRPSRHFRQ